MIKISFMRPYSEHYTWQVRSNWGSSVPQKKVFTSSPSTQALVPDAGRTCPSPRHTFRITEHTASCFHYSIEEAHWSRESTSGQVEKDFDFGSPICTVGSVRSSIILLHRFFANVLGERDIPRGSKTKCDALQDGDTKSHTG